VPRRRLLSLAAGAAAVSLVNRAPSAFAETDTIRFGLTPVFLTSDLDLLELLGSYLEAATGGPVELVTRRTYQEITALLISGRLDGAWICSPPFITYQAELELLAVPVWNGQPLYRSYLIADARREASSLEELAGDVHAFSDPDSNSGYVATAADLAAKGLKPELFFRRIIFTYGHRNVVRAVASGLAQSGSVDGYVYEVRRRRGRRGHGRLAGAAPRARGRAPDVVAARRGRRRGASHRPCALRRRGLRHSAARP
jgi:phosphonate transport system substrate-binding protein